MLIGSKPELGRAARAAGGPAGEPDHDARTRDRVLAAVSERGPITAAQIADDLGLTPPGVRRHLDQLLADGAVESRERTTGKRGRGRPAREWVVTEVGHDALPTHYDSIAVEAVRFLRQTAGDDAIQSFAQARATRLEERYAAEVDTAGTDPAERVEALVTALRRDGYAATVRPVGDRGLPGVQLCQGHCPVQHVAHEVPELCEAEAEAFSRLVGAHVQRLATLAQGDHVCTTFIPTSTPTERATR